LVTYEDIQYEISDHIALIRFNRPAVLNAIRIQTYQELILALHTANADESIKCILLTGNNKAFCAGNDLRDLLPGSDIHALKDGVAGIFNQLARLEKPLILAQEGVAVGIGANLLLHADLAIAGRSTQYSLPFARIGVCSEGASSFLLSEAIGPKRASELLLTGRNFSADEALNWGLLNQMCDDGQALDKALKMARILVNNSAGSLRAIRQLDRGADYVERINRVVGQEMQLFAKLLEGEDTQKRIRSVLERRQGPSE
jgi:enoyl-CoA hydratase/carnithine racemase